MSQVRGFPPVAKTDARVLILGSMPSVASLEKNEYYGLPQNVFWRIMGDLFGAGRDLPYAERLEKMVGHRIALWDVLETCYRPGSLDSAIDSASAEPNDFRSLFQNHATISRVFFNGRKASDLYMRRVLPTIKEDFSDKIYRTLPSTSPAHASMPYDQKLDKWSVVARAC